MTRGPYRITSDTSDRLKNKEALQSYMDTLATYTLPPGHSHLGYGLHVVTGRHATDNVDADKSIKIEREHYGSIESGCPTSFNNATFLLISTKKSIKLDGKPVCDTELICTRVMCLQQYRYIDITYVLSRLGTFPSASIII